MAAVTMDDASGDSRHGHDSVIVRDLTKGEFLESYATVLQYTMFQDAHDCR